MHVVWELIGAGGGVIPWMVCDLFCRCSLKIGLIISDYIHLPKWLQLLSWTSHKHISIKIKEYSSNVTPERKAVAVLNSPSEYHEGMSWCNTFAHSNFFFLIFSLSGDDLHNLGWGICWKYLSVPTFKYPNSAPLQEAIWIKAGSLSCPHSAV